MRPVLSVVIILPIQIKFTSKTPLAMARFEAGIPAAVPIFATLRPLRLVSGDQADRIDKDLGF